MKRVALAKASQPLSEYASALDDDIVVVTKGGRPLAALVPLKNTDRESLALSTHPEFLALIKKARAEVAAGRVLTLEQMRAKVLP